MVLIWFHLPLVSFALIWTSGTVTRGLFRRTPTVASHYLGANFHHCHSGTVARVTRSATNLSTRTVQDRTDCRPRFLVEQRKQLGESPLRMEQNRATEASRFDPCHGDDARRRPVAA